jgi:hypothetical protein
MGGFAKPIAKAIQMGNIKKVEEQPKVAAQTNAPVPENTTAGPTTAEMDNTNMIASKRRGRRSTILTSVTGVDTAPQLGKKSLLG